NSSDPFIQLAVELYETNLKFEEEGEELAGLLAQARPDYMRAIIAYNKSLGKPVYPDANSTLRISYGSVGGYPARDGVYKTPFTTVKGMIAKHTGESPFNVPKKVMDTYNAGYFGPYKYEILDRRVKTCSEPDCYKPRPTKLNSVPVNFLSSADTTGGNSGSPVMNGKGELVGLNFDSTYESITKDWYFNADITRAIHVDIRYVLWLLENVEKADNLINEMTINRG
ncbi:MAG: S46 family peptidase, partial [Psychrosphaera sp.]|nr:S46 family peptidase [Psychrosphaera sp.]